MRVLVIGGTGFVGPYVVERLAGAGHEVAVLHRGRTEAELPEVVRRLRGDRRDLLSDYLGGELRRLAPEIVLDVTPMSEKDARDMMGAFVGTARRIVAISSGDVYRAYGRLLRTEPGPPDVVPLGEDSPLRERLYPYREETPRTPEDPMRWADDYEKILVERVVVANPKLPGTILRLPAVYGPGDDRQHRLFPYLKRMDDGGPPSCSKRASPPGGGRTVTSRTSPPPSRWPSPTSGPPAGPTTSAKRIPHPGPGGCVRSAARRGGTARS